MLSARLYGERGTTVAAIIRKWRECKVAIDRLEHLPYRVRMFMANDLKAVGTRVTKSHLFQALDNTIGNTLCH